MQSETRISLSYSLLQVVSTSIIAVIGVDVISAKVYLTNIFFYVYVRGLALGYATSLMTDDQSLRRYPLL